MTNLFIKDFAFWENKQLAYKRYGNLCYPIDIIQNSKIGDDKHGNIYDFNKRNC
jgi:hypothetical protein